MNHAEDDLQATIAHFLDVALLPEVVWWAVPNGARMSIKQAKKHKKTGMKAGAPDVCIFHDTRAFFIELKRPDYRDAAGRARQAYTSGEQDDMHARLDTAGCPVAICKSLSDVEGTLAAWEIPMRAVT